jgi:hypothetical protein
MYRHREFFPGAATGILRYSTTMRILAVFLAASVSTGGCASHTYQIPASELQRLAITPPQDRGLHVRVVQQLGEEGAAPAQGVDGDTELVIFPQLNILGPDRGRYYGPGGFTDHRRSGGGSGGGPNLSGGGGGGGSGGGGHSGGGGGGGGDGKGAAIAILVAAAVILVAAAAVEGSRFDGYAQLHPMQAVHLFGRDGGYTVMPLAWIDPQTAAWAHHGVVRTTEGPFRALERAPLDREGFTYAMFGGLGTYTSADGSKDTGTATTIQLGYFPEQHVGILTSVFFGWRDNAVQKTLFESRYTVEVQGYPVVTGPLHLGLYGGLGAAYRWEDGLVGGNSGSSALIGGAVLQLDINTRLAITGRLGATYAHGENMADAMLGLAVY